MSYYVYSTLTCDNAYTLYEPTPPEQLSKPKRSILIKGGANVANKHVLTTKGVVTQVSDADMEMLKQNDHFMLHHKNGFIAWEKHKEDPEHVAKDMQEKDASAPKVPEDFKDKNVHSSSKRADVQVDEVRESEVLHDVMPAEENDEPKPAPKPEAKKSSKKGGKKGKK